MEVADPYRALAQAGGDAAGAGDVGGEDRADHAALGVVGQPYGLVLVCEGLHGEDRVERLLADDAHAAVAVVQHGRQVEVAGRRPYGGRLGAGAAAHQRGALGQGGGHVVLGLGELGAETNGPHSTPFSVLRPSRIFRARPTSSAMKPSLTDASMLSRAPAE